MIHSRIFLACGTALALVSCDGQQGAEDLSSRDMPDAPAAPDATIFEGEEVAYAEVVSGGPFATWLNRADAVGVRSAAYPDGMLFRFRSAGEMTHVVPGISPRTGDTYRAAIDVGNVEGARAQVRLMLSRDCATTGDEFSLAVHNVEGPATTISVEHTFAADYDCMKFVLQVLDASADSPKTLQLSSPMYSLVE